MALNKRRVARSRASSTRSSGQFARFEDGRTYLRIFTFHHTITKTDFVMKFYREQDGYKIGEEYDEVERQSAIHFTEDGQINCLGADCPYCAESQKLLDSGKKSDQQLGRKLRATTRFYVNAVDMDNLDNGMQIWTLPTSVFNLIISYIDDPEYGEGVIGIKGRDFIVERDSKQDPANVYTVKLRDRERSEKLDKSIQDNITDLFKCKVLDPGWSSNKELNKAEEREAESDDEKITSRRNTNKAKDENPYKDDEPAKEETTGKDGAPPWEKDREFKVGDIVTFKDPEEGEFEGPIISIDGDDAVVEADGDQWDWKLAELTFVKEGKKKSGRRK